MFYIGTCPFCEQGNLGVRICSKDCDAVILCDECEALWRSPDVSRNPVIPEQPNLPCPYCRGNLVDSPAHWAQFSEVYRLGWISAIKGEQD